MRPRPRHDALAIAGIVTVAAVIATLLALAPVNRARLARERRAVQKYAETISPLAFEGGRVTEERIKPALAQLVEGTLKAADFVRQSEGWKHDLSEIRRAFAAAPAPKGVKDASRIFDQAFRGYLAAVDAFVRGSSTQGAPEKIDGALEPGRVIARRADKTYDRARRLVQAELRRLGLPDALFS